VEPTCSHGIFVVVTNPITRARIRNAAENEEKEFYSHRTSKKCLEALAPLGTYKHKLFLESASCLIANFLKRLSHTSAGIKRKNYYTTESVGIAPGMLITALHYSGITTLAHAPNPMRFVNDILNRPTNERAYLLLIAGFPKRNTTVPDIRHYNLHEISSYIE